jgi:type VI secretion system protein VasJ
MLSSLLSALFGTRAPTDLARAAQVRWNAWLQPIDTTHPVGQDPGYDDDFLRLKDEVAKFSDIDDTLIVDTAQRLLMYRAKDARGAAYYVYGRLRRDGAEGIASGFELLSALIDRFGVTLLPARAGTRKAALEWLAGKTFANQLDRVDLSGSTPAFERALSALALIHESLERWPEQARPDLETLLRRFQGYLEAPASARQANRENAAMPTVPSVSAEKIEEVASARDVLEQGRHMAQYLRAQPHGYLAAYRLLRCIRWDTLGSVPPHDPSGRTRLLAPRAELRAQFKRLLLQKQWVELLESIETAFAEAANHFWLDLQSYAFTAQEHAGGYYALIRDQAATDCALMLERLPGLEHLAFADGTPFADETTLAWIARYATVRDIERGDPLAPMVVAAAHTDWAHTDWTETEAHATELATQQSLDAAFSWLQTRPAQPGERDRFIRYLLMARIAECAEQPDTALHLLTTLEQLMQRFQLGMWDPRLVFDAKQQLLRLLQARMHRKDTDKPALATRIDALIGELTALDPARAVTLFPNPSPASGSRKFSGSHNYP